MKNKIIKKEILCYPLSTEPVIDGKIGNDKVWKNIPRTDGNFFVSGILSEVSKKKTYFRAGYDSNSLFIAVECEEPDMQNMVAILKDGEDLFSEDSIEMFIMPGNYKKYFQFIANAAGSRYNGILRDKTPLMKWEAKTSTSDKIWSMEIKIPFKALGAKPKKGDKWGFNICRNICSGYPILKTTWAMLRQSFHEPKNFGQIIFK